MRLWRSALRKNPRPDQTDPDFLRSVREIRLCAANEANSEMIGTNRAVRAGAAGLSLLCMALSLTLLLRLGFLGFAIGGWTGLKGYEQAIADARHTAHTTELLLAILQVLGGAFAFITFRRRLGVLWVSTLHRCFLRRHSRNLLAIRWDRRGVVLII